MNQKLHLELEHQSNLMKENKNQIENLKFELKQIKKQEKLQKKEDCKNVNQEGQIKLFELKVKKMNQENTNLNKTIDKIQKLLDFEKNTMKHVKEELEEQIETLTKELELASVKSRSLILPEQTQQSAELISKVERLEMQLKEAMESEVAQRNSTRDLERQVEVESNNSRLVQDQYSSLKQM